VSSLEIIFLSSALLTCIIGIIILCLNHWRTINQAYAIASILASVWLFGVSKAIGSGRISEVQQSVIVWLTLANATAAFLPWSFAIIKIAITDSCTLWQSLIRCWSWFLAGIVLAIMVGTSVFAPTESVSMALKDGFFYQIYLCTLAILCLLVFIDACRGVNTCHGVRQLELKFFVINICVTTLTVIVSFIASGLLDLPLLRYVAPFMILMSSGLTFWAVFHHRVFDSRQIFASIARRVSNLAFLSTIIFFGYTILSEYCSPSLALIVSACVGGTSVAIWDKQISKWFDLDSNRKLSGPRAKIIEWAREEADTGRLIKRYEGLLSEWSQAEKVKIHTLENRTASEGIGPTIDYAKSYPLLLENGYITTETLYRLRPSDSMSASENLLKCGNLGAIIAVPRGSQSPSCLVELGYKQSLRPYTHPDIQLLIELVEAIDNILAHSQVAAHAARLEKMESAAMMSRGLSHDLNNLTTPVSTFLLHMESRVQPGSVEAEVLADAQHSIEVMQNYIRESLFFASRLTPDFKRLSAASLATSVAKLTQMRANSRGVQVVLEKIEDLDLIADEALIRRLLQNLIFNGIDATPRGHTVTFSVTAVDNNKVRFQVSDQGPGIPPAIMDKLFEPYFTTKDTGNEIRGLGLGLAISQKISVLHSGEIKVSNSAMGGTTFSFILPSEQKARAAQPAATIRENQVTIKPPTAASSGAPA
jgi:signal transduction histidine kinase